MLKIILEQRVTFFIFFFEIYFTRLRRPKLLDLLFVWPWKNYEELMVPCCKQLPPVREFTIDFSIPNVMTIDIGIERTRCRDSLIHSWWCNQPSNRLTCSCCWRWWRCRWFWLGCWPTIVIVSKSCLNTSKKLACCVQVLDTVKKKRVTAIFTVTAIFNITLFYQLQYIVICSYIYSYNILSVATIFIVLSICSYSHLYSYSYLKLQLSLVTGISTVIVTIPTYG